MDLKRWLMALALTVLLTAPIGAPTTALAAGGEPEIAGATYHDQEGEGEGEDEQDGEGEGEGGEEVGVLEGIAKTIKRISDLL